MNQIQNIMRREAGQVQNTKAFPRRGIVTSYDPNRYAAKVRIQPEDVETGFLPIGTPWVGNGWGLLCPPTSGDEVDVHFQEGGKNAAYITLRFYGDAALPPGVAPSGEFWLVHKSGGFLKLTNDGKVSLNGHVEADITAPTVNITAATAVNVTAPQINLGSSGETLRKLVNDAFMAIYNGHTHGGSTIPSPQMDGSELTTVTSAG